MTARILLVLAAMVAAMQPLRADEDMPTIKRATHGGQEIRVRAYTRFDAQCKSPGLPEISIVVPPAHGVATVRQEDSEITVLRPGAPNCIGHIVPGLGVWYRPAPGFQGVDRFDLRVTYSREAVAYTAIITVQ